MAEESEKNPLLELADSLAGVERTQADADAEMDAWLAKNAGDEPAVGTTPATPLTPEEPESEKPAVEPEPEKAPEAPA